MDFTLPPEHLQLQTEVRRFCDENIAPIAQTIESEQRFPEEIFEGLAALDLMGVPIAEEYGGAGFDQLAYSIVCEELGRVSGSIALSYAAHVSLGTKPIEAYGTPVQQSEWLRPLATGDMIGAWALTEPESGSDASNMQTTAVWDTDAYVLNGTKQFITNASVAGSILVKAVTDPTAGYDGISTFIVDTSDEGFTVTSEWEKLGLNASPTCEIQFNDLRLPEDRLLGKEGAGWDQTVQTLEGGRISIAAVSVGLGQGAFDAALEYAQEREQFGEKIASFDAIRNKLVEMDRKLERARLLTRKAATRYDTGEDVTRLSSLAKLDASEIAREIAEESIQVLGGYGYTEAYTPQRMFRDAKLMEIGEGTSEIQRLILGRELGI